MGSKHAIDKETRDRALRAISALSEPDDHVAMRHAAKPPKSLTMLDEAIAAEAQSKEPFQ